MSRSNRPLRPKQTRRPKGAGYSILSQAALFLRNFKVDANTRFSWDERCRQSNLADTGVDLLDAALMFERPRKILIAGSVVNNQHPTVYYVVGCSDDIVYFVHFELAGRGLHLLNAHKVSENDIWKYQKRLTKRSARHEKSKGNRVSEI